MSTWILYLFLVDNPELACPILAGLMVGAILLCGTILIDVKNNKPKEK